MVTPKMDNFLVHLHSNWEDVEQSWVDWKQIFFVTTSTYTPQIDTEVLLVLTLPGKCCLGKNKLSLNGDLCPTGRCTCIWNPLGVNETCCLLAPKALHGLCFMCTWMFWNIVCMGYRDFFFWLHWKEVAFKCTSMSCYYFWLTPMGR